MNPIIPIIIVLIANFFGAIGVLLLKLGSKNFQFNLSIIKHYSLIFGFIISISAAAVFIFMLKYGELSILYSLSSTTYLWITLFSKVFLKESVPKLRVVGIVGIIIGIVLILI